MLHVTLKAGACALGLIGFAGYAAATPAIPHSAPSIVILAGDEENAEVQNLLEPQTDGGAPRDEGGPANPPPAAQGGEGSAERALESTVGDDGINAIQRESIPEE